MTFLEAIPLYLLVACMTVKPPPPAPGQTKAAPTQPIARPDLPAVCRQINEWTAENWPSAQTGIPGKQPK
jgi:hypothetical protein